MKYLFRYWQDISSQIKSAKRVLLLLDYDGTLTPIVETPSLATLTDEMKEILRSVSRNRRFRIGIVSGRALSELKDLVGIRRLFYAGNHGLEIEGPEKRFIHPWALKARPIIAEISQLLTRKLSGIEGIIVEDKGLTLSLHYRLLKGAPVSKVKKIFNDVTRPYIQKGKIEVNTGKKVLEIRPSVDWDKGKVIFWIAALISSARRLAKGGILPIYLGDDKTDEDAFLALSDNGISISVGQKGISCAKYYLKTPSEVKEFLRRLTKKRDYGR